MSYRHQLSNEMDSTDSLGKIVCVGRNYAEHAKELNNPIPKQPLLFIKPATAAVAMQDSIVIPRDKGACHHELEMALLIGSKLTSSNKDSSDQEFLTAIAGIGLALDLTLRDIQDVMKEKGQPWERAKAFDGSCPLSNFVSAKTIDLQNIDIKLIRNDQLQQSGNTRDMLFPIASLLREISSVFTLLPGDIVLTGTPAGVGPLVAGDKLKAILGDVITIETDVC